MRAREKERQVKVSNNDLTYDSAVRLVLRKLGGDAVDETHLKAALAAYPEISRRLRREINAPPSWALAGLTQMVELEQAGMERVLKEQQKRQLSLNVPSSQISLDHLFKQFGDVGLDSNFVIQRLVPRLLVEHLLKEETTLNNEEVKQNLIEVAWQSSQPFGWTLEQLFGSTRLPLNMEVVAKARFKMAVRTNQERTNAYTVYAHYLALVVLELTAKMPKQVIPTNPTEVRQAVIKLYGTLTFENVLRYVWSLGIPVLPLNDAGAFHGACWRNQGHNIIVLKQQTQYLDRWLIDLLHELRHAGENPEQLEQEAVETEEIGLARRNAPEEKIADRFAWNVALNSRAEELTKMCESAARGNIPRLKGVVAKVANNAGVSAGTLANYLAYRLSLQGENWWGTAKSFQSSEPNPLVIARKVFLEHVELVSLNEVDRDLLSQALSEAILN